MFASFVLELVAAKVIQRILATGSTSRKMVATRSHIPRSDSESDSEDRDSEEDESSSEEAEPVFRPSKVSQVSTAGSLSLACISQLLGTIFAAEEKKI